MIISLRWLNDYIDISDLTPSVIADTLTQLGLEVEGFKSFEPYDKGLVLASVVEAKRHPNADTLSLCQVDAGTGGLLSIVCGAHNVRTGLRVVLASVGSKLPDGTLIQKAKLRGELSEGMLCSERELQLSDDHAGILELPLDLPVGSRLSSYIDRADTVLELKITPQRADALSYLGLARELSAKLHRPIKTPKKRSRQAQTESEEGATSSIILGNQKKIYHEKEGVARDLVKPNTQVLSESSELCGNFLVVSLTGVHEATQSSPIWLRQRLLASGVRPVHWIVDISNYVMLEYGQPTHAYDQDKLVGQTLGLRQVKKEGGGQSFEALDGKTYSLQEGDLVICDEQGPVALAGVMGGARAEVCETTKALLIEIAQFHPVWVRKAAKRLALHTEASHRFERGVDPGLFKVVADRIVQLIREVSEDLQHSPPGESLYFELNEKMRAFSHPKKVSFRLSRLRKVLAIPTVSLELCMSHLQPLGFITTTNLQGAEASTPIELLVPSHRHDIESEADIIEEVGRMLGYSKIPYEVPEARESSLVEDPYLSFRFKLKTQLATLGLSEVVSYPFVGAQELEQILLPATHPLYPQIRLLNPMSAEQNYLRALLLPSLLTVLSRNRHRGQQGGRIFEVARAFLPLKSSADLDKKWLSFLEGSRQLSIKARAESGRAQEKEILGLLLDQPWGERTWDHGEAEASFWHAKEILVSLFSAFGFKGADLFSEASGLQLQGASEAELPFLHPGRSAFLLTEAGLCIAWLGEIHPRVAASFGLGEKVPVAMELNLEAFYQVLEDYIHKQKLARASAPLRFPAANRDLALLLDDKVSYQKFSEAISTFQKKHLRDFRLFDVYTDEKLGDNKKSFAASFVFQSAERTLTDVEVADELQKLLDYLKSSLGAEQR
ncbi:MAG: phenylalanine--tRNA ligase subunit beta [Oligoflexales bacterium]|nr:phenylalanine--tRNA ligase subunit beta [Oligoflexales bacterium]